MPKPQITGVAVWGVDWQYVATNRDLARRVFVFLEDRRVLVQGHDREDFVHTRESANQIRNFLTLEIMNVKAGGPLEKALRAIRSASTAFVSAAGPDSRDFYADGSFFVATLRAYREAVATQIANISVNFQMELDLPLLGLLKEFDISSYRP